jgi:hypothetical protein
MAPVVRLSLEKLEDRTLPALTWSSGIALPSARSGDVAILEPDNSLLVLGGTRTVNQLAANGTAWTTANPLDVSRTAPGVAPIGGAELLVYGGVANETGQSSALQYDPTNSSNIQAVASMSTVRSLMAFAADGSGRAYAIGGMIAGDDVPTRLASVERFDPATGQWSAVASLPVGLSGATAVYDGNGHILVFGGATSSATATTAAYRYTVATNTWAALPALPTATTEAAAALGADGTVYVLGGLNTSGAAQATVQAYHPTTNTWTTETSLPVALSDEAAVTDSQGRVEVLGGKNAQHSSVSSVYVTQSLGTGNVAPVIATPANTTAVIGAAFTDAISAFGLPAPTFSLTAAPTGMTIDSTTGVISWTPTSGQLGAQTVTVQATNASGTDSKTFTVTGVPDTTPPTVPQNLTLGTVTTTTASFSWLASTDNVAVAGYRIYTYVPAYGGGRGGHYHPPVYTLVGTSTTTSGTATGLTPGYSYNFVVTAVDTSGNESGYSNIVTTTMLLAPSIYYSDNGVDVDPPVSVIANHSLLLSVWDPSNPPATLSIVSAPSGVSFAFYGTLYLTWTPTASQVGVNDIVLQSVNSVGTATLDIPVTVVADVPIPSLTVNGSYAYTVGNYNADPVNPFTWSLTLNPGFGASGNHPQYGLVGTPFAFQLGGTTNTNPVTYTLVSGPAGMTLDPNSGAGTWTPAPGQDGPTSVTVQETNSAGTSTLTFNFPTYFTTAPTGVAVNFYTSTSSTGSYPPDFTTVVSWTAPPDNGIAGYYVTVTNANTQVATTYDTQSTATSFALPSQPLGQQFVTVSAYDAAGNPSVASNSFSFYILAMQPVSWTFSTPNAVAGDPLSVQFHPASPYYSYAIASGPAGATINPTTGLLSWTPGLGDVGTANFVVSATNGWGSVFVTLNVPVYFTSAAQAIAVTNDTANINATWTAPPENAGNIAGYNVTLSYAVNGQTFTTTYTTPTPATNFAIPIPVYDTTIVYHLTVTAVDGSGNLGAPMAAPFDFHLS